MFSLVANACFGTLFLGGLVCLQYFGLFLRFPPGTGTRAAAAAASRAELTTLRVVCLGGMLVYFGRFVTEVGRMRIYPDAGLNDALWFALRGRRPRDYLWWELNRPGRAEILVERRRRDQMNGERRFTIRLNREVLNHRWH